MTSRFFRRFAIWAAPLVAVMVMLTVFSRREETLLRLAPVQTPHGWGYRITVDNKPFIHQDRVPALPGYIPFRTKEDAMRVGELVMHKLRHHLSPAVTRREIDSLRIQL